MKYLSKILRLSFASIICSTLIICAGCGKAEHEPVSFSSQTEPTNAVEPATTAEPTASAQSASPLETTAPTVQTAPAESATRETLPFATGQSNSISSILTEAEKDFINRYLGRWKDENGHCALMITELHENQATFFWNVGTARRAAEVGFTVGERQNNTITFSFEDSWGNRGDGTLTLLEDHLHISTTISDPAPDASFSAAVDLDLYQTTQGSVDDYLLYDSSVRYLSEEELSDLNSEELRLARNEIYARHGRIFTDPALSEYFSGKFWYVSLYTAENFDALQDELLNDYERANIDLILNLE